MEKGVKDVDNDDAPTRNPEQIIEDLGGCGRYQMRMSIVSHLMKMSLCWSYMSFIIIIKAPEFWCDSDANRNDTLVQELNNTQYDAYKACLSVDGTKCTKFRYDDSLRTIITDFDLVCDNTYTVSAMQSIQNAANLAGNLVVGHIADLIGRKPPYFGSILLVAIVEFASLAAKGWVLIAITRFCIGIAQGAFLTIIYSLLSEFTLARHRVWAIGFPSWPLETALFCLVAWLTKDWRYMNLACAVICIPCILAWWVIPESFRWYLAHGEKDKAEKVLEVVSKYNKKPRVDPRRLEEIAEEEINKKAQKYSLLDLFKTRQLAKVSVFLGVIWFGQSFIAYGLTFGVRSLSGNIYLNLLLFQLVAIPAKTIALWTQNRYHGHSIVIANWSSVYHKPYCLVLIPIVHVTVPIARPIVDTFVIFGRRLTSFVGFLVVSSACFGIAAVEKFVSDSSLRGSLTNGLALTAYCCVAILWSSVQTMTVELYPTVVRNIGFGFMAVLGSAGTIISPQFDFLGDVKGVPGLIYIACGGVGLCSLFALFWLPETKDAYLEDTIHVVGVNVVEKETAKHRQTNDNYFDETTQEQKGVLEKVVDNRIA